MIYYKKKVKDNIGVSSLQEEVDLIKAKLSEKANKDELEFILRQKSEYADLARIYKIVEDLENNLKMTVSQIGAMQKVVADPLKAKGLERTQREYLSKVTQRLFDLILR